MLANVGYLRRRKPVAMLSTYAAAAVVTWMGRTPCLARDAWRGCAPLMLLLTDRNDASEATLLSCSTSRSVFLVARMYTTSAEMASRQVTLTTAVTTAAAERGQSR